MGFFSWGLEQRTPLNTAFARRQIDDCDYVVILLGSQYGEQSVSGVGYMHLGIHLRCDQAETDYCVYA